ncbi:MAG: D-glycero-beta-D-manno-heptose-7-phosphate kinase [Chlorobi bacterium]|nr:D-glycero-beta-D-manno-heptose-7-phosphate kinase [Chlorobiota bacterium]
MSVLIIGDVMIDSYMWGKVNRISPEAPVPVVSITKRENRLGGAANVALNIKALGAKAILASVIGNDERGKIFLNLLKERELVNDGILTCKERITTSKHRVISAGQHILRVDQETNLDLDEKTENDFISNTLKIIKEQNIDVVIFEDYDKGVITTKVIEKITEKVNKKGIPVTVDPKKRNFNNYKNVTLFKPNFKELTEGLKLDCEKNNFDEIHRAAQNIQKTKNIKSVLITLSELGVIISSNGNYYQIPSHVRDISDVSGAGDTVISIASLCLAAGFSPKEISFISNMAGGQVCEKVGVVPVNKEQLLKDCSG